MLTCSLGRKSEEVFDIKLNGLVELQFKRYLLQFNQLINPGNVVHFYFRCYNLSQANTSKYIGIIHFSYRFPGFAVRHKVTNTCVEQPLNTVENRILVDRTTHLVFWNNIYLRWKERKANTENTRHLVFFLNWSTFRKWKSRVPR